MTDVRQATSTSVRSALDLAANDPQLRALMPLPAEDGTDQPLHLLIDRAMRWYATRPALGVRDYEIGPDPDTGTPARIPLPHFSTISYGTLHRRIKQLAAAWQTHPRHRVAPAEFVAIVGFTGVDHVVVDYACAYARAVSVPLASPRVEDLTAVFAKVEPTCVTTSIDDLVATTELVRRTPSVRSVIVFDHDPRIPREREQLHLAGGIISSSSSAELVILDELIADFTAADWGPQLSSESTPDRIAMLLHSSGSTGEPKGAILTERLVAGIYRLKFPQVPVIVVAFAPWNHRAGQFAVSGTLARGGTAYFTAKPDLSTLFEDIRLARPTELVLFPRVMELIHNNFLGEVARQGAGGAEADIRELVKSEMRREFLGDRLCSLVHGSAPISPELKRFMADCFRVPMTDRYGTTELGSIMVDGRIARPPVIDYCLRDVPELGYFSDDKPYPRGELCVKTETGILGYYNQPEATARLFDEKGYYRTGDILEERAPDELVFVDRVNDVLKLSQGEFVATGTLGALFEEACSSIQQIYVHGDPARSYLLAVIVPDANAIGCTSGALLEEALLKARLRSELRAAATKHGLRPVEVPRDFLVEHTPFSFENGLLTSVRKRRRPALKERYGQMLEQMYLAHERRQAEELATLGADSSLSIQDRIVKALEATLGIGRDAIDLSRSFSDLGGDSLGATDFALLLTETFGTEISVNAILSPAGNVRSWAAAIERAREGDRRAPFSYARVHPAGAPELRAEYLRKSAFSGVDPVAAPAPADLSRSSRYVLLTGATGFLGRFLCLEWLERLAKRHGRLFCLVRAADQADARQRLNAIYATDPVLARRFEELAEGHLSILVGDVAEPDLGLGKEAFARLAAEIDHIVHCGALVNHMLGYADLFDANVGGTVQLLRLALARRIKRFDFISSVAVCGLLTDESPKRETSPLPDVVVPRGNYAEGYAISTEVPRRPDRPRPGSAPMASPAAA